MNAKTIAQRITLGLAAATLAITPVQLRAKEVSASLNLARQLNEAFIGVEFIGVADSLRENDARHVLQFVDGDPNARNAFLNKISVGGGELANGYIHGVDRVLRPIDL